MPVETELRRKIYTVDGISNPPLVVPFYFLENSDLTVRLYDASGAETVLDLNTDYTVSGAGAPEGGQVTLLATPPTGQVDIERVVPLVQRAKYPRGGGFPAQAHEAQMDRQTMALQQVAASAARGIQLPSSDGDGAVQVLPARASRLGRALVFDPNTGDVGVSPDHYVNQTAAVQALADEAEASAATATEQALSSVGFAAAKVLTVADSPYAVNSGDAGCLLVCDTSAGDISITLPEVSAMPAGFDIGIQKRTADANTVTAQRSGTDVFFGGATTFGLAVARGVRLLANAGVTPNAWVDIPFGQTAVDRRRVFFVAGTDFTAGSSTQITLPSGRPAGAAALDIYFDGAYVQADQWGYTAATGVVTFLSAIPANVSKIEAKWMAPLAQGVPGDGTLGPEKLAQSTYDYIQTLTPMPAESIEGLKVSPGAGDVAHTVDITAGRIRAANSAAVIELAATTLSLLNAGHFVNGGALAASSTYHLLVGISGGSAVAAFSQTVSLPAGWTAFRCLWSILTDASSDLAKFRQQGDRNIWCGVPPVTAFNFSGAGALLGSLFIPTGIEVDALVNYYSPSASGTFARLALLHPDQDASAVPGTGGFPLGTTYPSAGTETGNTTIVSTDAQARIQVLTSATSASVVRVVPISFVHPRRTMV